MLSLILPFLLLQGDGKAYRQDVLLTRDGSQPRLMLQQQQEPLDKPKKSPKLFGENKMPFEFEWLTAGYARMTDAPQHELRLRVYSQERKFEGDTAHAVARMLMRLWDLNQSRLGIDHKPRDPDGYRVVNVYVTWGGKAGGEQFTSADVEGNKRVTANNIFLYDLASFTDPLEMAREVAHEYGHATLPAIGVYKGPEDWANGYLGEKLYLLWVRDILAAKQLEPSDFVGVTKDQLDGWLRGNVDPLVAKVAIQPPTMGQLADRSAAGMDAYLGMVLYMAEVLPPKVFARSMKLIGSQSARDYPGAVFTALEEPDEAIMTIPPSLRGKTIWVPVGRRVLSGAKVLALENGWAKVDNAPEKIEIRRKG